MIFIGEIGVPLAPSGHAVLLLTGSLVSQGTLRLPLVIIVGVMAAAMGGSLLYLAARSGGRGLVFRFGRFMKLREDRIERAGRHLNRRSHLFLPASRFIPGMRMYGSALSGAFVVPYARFLAATVGGSILWVGLMIYAGQAMRGDAAGAMHLFPPLAASASFIMLLPLFWRRLRTARAGRD